MYQTLYRKYRPSTFDEVVGQKVIVKTLKNAIINNKLSHAYIFTGPRGTGKTSIAKILAKTINCEDLNGYIPCNNCINCKQNINNPIDIIEIDAASNNGVDEIRELKNKINLIPAYGKYKIYIIDEVHMLSTGAFNALLKTLEEPPAHIIFVLATTDPHKVPTTIMSRCQRFDFKKLNISEITERMAYIIKLENIGISDEALKEIAILSDGGMRDSLSLLDQVNSYSDNEITADDVHEINGTITKKEMLNFLNLLVSNNIKDIFDKIENFNDNGKDFIKLSEELILFMRDILISLTVTKCIDDNISLEKIKEIITVDKIVKYIEEFNQAIYNMKNSSIPKLNFELTIIKLLNLKQKNNLNVEEIRINNTLCNFNKKELLIFKSMIKDIENKTNDEKYNEIKLIINDSELKAIGKQYMIFVLEKQKDIDYYNSNLDIVDELFNKTYNESYKSIAVSKEKWETIKKEFNNKEKEYIYISE